MGDNNEPSQPAAKPYTLGGIKCHSLAELAAAMGDNPEAAAEHLSNGYIQKWLEEELRDFDGKIALDARLEKHSIQRGVFEFALDFAPQWEPKIQGLAINPESLTAFFTQLLKDLHIARTPLATLVASLIYDWGLLTDQRITNGDKRLAKIDSIWRKEVDLALLVRGEMLRREGFYAVPGDGSENYLLADRSAELDFVRRTISSTPETEAEVAKAISRTALGLQSDILAELLGTPDPSITPDVGFVSRYSVREQFQFDEAIKRPWFADLLANMPDERGAGYEAALRDAMDVAAAQTRAIESGAATAAGDEGAGKLTLEDRMNAVFDKLGVVQTALVFAVPVLILTLLYGTGAREWDGPQFGLIDIATYMAIGATIGFAPLRLLSLSGVNGGALKTFKMPILAFLSLVIGLMIAAVYHEGLYYNDWDVIAGFTILAGLAGAARKPSMALRKKQRGKLAERMGGLGDKDSVKLVSFARVQANFFPETFHALPQAERTAADYRLNAAIERGMPAPAGQARHADARSPAAPNNPSGVSLGTGGNNIAADRATFEVMDGVSIDTKGNFNTRLVDGLTVHSEGGYTTRVMDGVDVRSDGQISVEGGGARFSFGGKKKETKDEWDWGTGEKKGKGWFD